MKLLSAAALALALASTSLAADQKPKDDPSQIGDRNVGKCLNFYSIQKEMALGQQLAQEVAKQSKIFDDPIVSEYVNRIGQNLARNSDAKVPFVFQVIDSDEANAFALPGGYVFVYTGLIKVASEEDEFAGALAHEIAHVAARHMTCQATKSQIAGVAAIIPGVLLGGWAGYGARQAINAAVPMAYRGFSRHDETEADYLGVQYMYAAGYDPTGAVSIFEKLESMQKTKPGAVAKVLATHPMDSDRIDRTEKEIQRILPSKPEYVVTTSEYRGVRERLITLENRRQPSPENRPHLIRAGDDKLPDTDSGTRPTVKRRDIVE
ncbi:MAG: M48 family metallopeptidase [Bryobacteraceae bacterium]|jgi:predicted Zn-dependent protease